MVDPFESAEYPGAPRLEDRSLTYDDYVRYKHLDSKIRSIERSFPRIECDPVTVGCSIWFWLWVLGFGAVACSRSVLGESWSGMLIIAILVGAPILALAISVFGEPAIERRCERKKVARDLRVADATRAERAEFEPLKERNWLFEKDTYQYFFMLARSIHDNELYRRRSASEGFNDSLNLLMAVLKRYDDVRSQFVSQQYPLSEFSSYARARMQNLKAEEDGNTDAPTRSQEPSASTVPQKSVADAIILGASRPKVAGLPPQAVMHVPRKVDWTKVEGLRRATGHLGEQIVLNIEKEYLTSIGHPELAAKVCNVALTLGDGTGYDILSYYPDGSNKYIEVKSTSGKLDSSFILTRNEISFLESHMEVSFVYRVQIVSVNDCLGQVQSWSAHEVLKANRQAITFAVMMSGSE